MNWSIPYISVGLLFLLPGSILLGQDVDVAGSARLNSADPATPISLFKKVDDPFVRLAYDGLARNQQILMLDRYRVRSLEIERPTDFLLTVPGEVGQEVLLLERVEVVSPDFRMRTSDGRTIVGNDILTYHGRIQGRDKSIAAVSIHQGEVQIMFSDSRDNYRIQKSPNQHYIFYSDREVIEERTFNCETDDEDYLAKVDEQIQVQSRATSGNCVEIYVECDYQSFLDNGSDTASVLNWVIELFNEVAIIFANDGVRIQLSELFVWTEVGPYSGLSSSLDFLNTFTNRMDTVGYNGDIGHIISSGGVRAGRARSPLNICGTTPFCFSGDIAAPPSQIQPFPVYSWSIMVLTHEMGHVMGSPHTHACAWNGNSTQIDDCGNVIDDTPPRCYDPPGILPESGTIMSYCIFIDSIGVAFTNGFGPQPKALINNAIANASCGLGACSVPECVAVSQPVNGDSSVSIVLTATWSQVLGAAGYYVLAGTSAGAADLLDTLDVGAATMAQLNGLPFASLVYLTVLPYDVEGTANGCQSISFVTEQFVTPGCAQMLTPSNGEVNVPIATDLIWTPATGTVQGYMLDVGTSSGGSELYADLDVGFVTSWTPPSNLPPETTIYVRVSPYGGPDTLNVCQEASFATGPTNAGDVCSIANTIYCGTTVSGSTVGASFDSAPSCGTSNTSPGVWHTFISDGSHVTLSTCGQASFDTKISVYRGTCDNLICVAGADDFLGCSGLTQLVPFSTTPNTQYYILVHGFDQEIGSYSLSMSCADDSYCRMSSRNSEEAWISNFEIGEISHASEASIYSDFTDVPLSVKPGGTYSLQATVAFGGNTQNVYWGMWIDYDQDSVFEASEQEVSLGPVAGLLDTLITFPTNLADQVRLRLIMSLDGHPAACQSFFNGEVEDYVLSNGSCLQVVNTLPSGPGSLPFALGCTQVGDTVTFHDTLDGDTIVLQSALSIEKDLCIMADGDAQISIDASSIERALTIDLGQDVVLQGMMFIAGNATIGSGIANYGDLVLRDVEIVKKSGVDGLVLFNAWAISFEGMTDIRD